MPEDTSVLPAVIGFVGTIVGAVCATGGTLFIETMKGRRERRSIETSIAATIYALLSATERRGHVANLTSIAERMEKGEHVQLMGFADKESFMNRAAENCLSRAHLLPERYVHRATRFFMQFLGILTDLQKMVAKEFGDDPALHAYILRQDLELWSEIEQVGGQLIKELRRD